MKIAVTGATGFLGAHVVPALAMLSDSVTLVCRPGTRVSGAMDKHDVVSCDIADPPVDLFERLGRPDVLLHLAWDGLPNYKSRHHFEAELPKQYEFLRGLIASGLPKVVVAGTCFEYGMVSGALDEKGATFPSNPYGFAKDSLRHQLLFLRREFDFSMTWARLFYMYGPGQPGNSLWGQFHKALDAGAAAFPMSGGEQLRDYLPVEEVASCLAACAIDRQDRGAVNICSGAPISVRALVESWLAVDGRSMRLDLGAYPYPDYEPFAFWGRRDELDSILGSR